MTGGRALAIILSMKLLELVLGSLLLALAATEFARLELERLRGRRRRPPPEPDEEASEIPDGPEDDDENDPSAPPAPDRKRTEPAPKSSPERGSRLLLPSM